MKKKRIEYKITGLVQGVSFRYYAKSEGKNLGLSGFVRNMPDGSLCVVAEGESQKLEEFTFVLQKGPKSARIEGFEAKEVPIKGQLEEFSVVA